MKHQPNRWRGFTLLEMLVALLIGMLLLLAVTNAFVSSTQTYRLLEARSYLVEGGRMAVEVLTQDIRQAGSWGCLGDDYTAVKNRLTDTTGFPQGHFPAGVRAFVEASTGWGDLPQAVRSAALSGVPVLLLTGARDTGVRIRDLDASTHQLSAIPAVWDSLHAGLGVGDYLLAVSGTCETGDLFQLTSLASEDGALILGYASQQQGIAPGNETFEFMSGLGLMAGQNNNNEDRGAQLYQVFTRLYFIGKDASSSVWSDEPGLMVWDAATNEVRMLVEDIHDLYLAFGAGSGGTASTYVRDVHAQERPLVLWDAADWATVQAVRYALLAMSPENAVERGTTLVFRPEADALTLSNRHAEVFTGTTALRSRSRN